MNAAVYVDFENLYLSLKNRNNNTGLRTRELSLQILEGLQRRLRELGNPMTLGRSYAAFDAYPGLEVAHDLALMGLDPQYVLISHSGKNSADIQLSLDVARVVFRRPDIEMIVIVSGDRDFIPLARQVLEEGRDLRVVAIPDTTSGDLRARVGADRFWDALNLLDGGPEAVCAPAPEVMEEAAMAPAPAAAVALPSISDGAEVLDDSLEDESVDSLAGSCTVDSAEDSVGDSEDEGGTVVVPQAGPKIVGHIPVTWNTGVGGGASAGATSISGAPLSHEGQLQNCLELLLRARLRHSSEDIWLSPFLKGPMSQCFSNLVHPERRALINELRNRGVIMVQERENAFAEHPYSVIVIQDEHPMSQAAWTKVQRGLTRT